MTLDKLFLCCSCWGEDRWAYLEDHELGELPRNWTLRLSSSSCVSAQRVQTMDSVNLNTDVTKWVKLCSGYSSGTLRTFIAFSIFFLFLEVFLPVEYLTFRSRTVGPSAWKIRLILNKNSTTNLNHIWMSYIRIFSNYFISLILASDSESLSFFSSSSLPRKNLRPATRI